VSFQLHELSVRPATAHASSNVLFATAAIALAAVVTGLPILGHLSGQPVGMAICFVLVMLVAVFAAPMLPVVLVFSYLFQNLFVALVSPEILDLNEFKAIRGYNFLLTATAWMVVIFRYWIDRASFDRRFRALMNVSFLGLGLVGLYFAIGLASSPTNAAIYLRNIATPLMLFGIFAVVAARFRLTIQTAFAAMAYAVVAYGYAELFFHEPLLRLVNGDVYLQLLNKQSHDAGVWVKEMLETGRVFRSDLDALEVELLNTPLLGDHGIRVFRLLGPNFHPISYAYALAAFSLIAAGTGSLIYWALSLPLLIVIGSKGALALVLLSVAGFVGSKLLGGRWLIWCYLAVLAAYAAVGIAVGIRAEDYHVIGFIGGVKGFLQNVLGHGLGTGGNWSLDMAQLDWGRSQRLGHTDVAVESAVGVLLFQMGIAALVLLGCVASLAWRAWGLYIDRNDRLTGIVALGVLTVLVNGIFQEEALFSPLALGVMMGILGLMLGRALRQNARMAVPATRVDHLAEPFVGAAGR
jgi:hypothetical protein